MRVETGTLMWHKSDPVRLTFVLVLAAALGGASCGPNTTDPHATSDVRAQACANCHLTAYALTANPAHANLFPKTCESCHNTQAWIPGTVPAPLHPKFTLAGAHADTSCAQCHPGSPARYAGTPTTCSTCHAADSQRAAAAIPGHNTFPMACDSCHTTSAWNPTLMGAGNHPESLFPITKGAHANAAIACTDCHIASRGSPTKGQNCDCIHCHLGAHEEPAIDSIHASVSGYKATTASAPNACLGCHSAG